MSIRIPNGLSLQSSNSILDIRNFGIQRPNHQNGVEFQFILVFEFVPRVQSGSLGRKNRICRIIPVTAIAGARQNETFTSSEGIRRSFCHIVENSPTLNIYVDCNWMEFHFFQQWDTFGVDCDHIVMLCSFFQIFQII